MTKFTKNQKDAIKRICEEYDFEDWKEIRAWLRENYGDTFDGDWFENDNYKDCYNELARKVAGPLWNK